MKQSLYLLALNFLLFLSFEATGQKSQLKVISNPVEYNDYIINQQNSIGSELKVLISIVTNDSSFKTQALTELSILTGVVEEAVNNLQNLKPIDPDSGLTASAIDLFSFYKLIMSTSYKELIDEIYAEAPDSEKMNRILTTITEDEAKYDAAFQSSQQYFSEYYNFTLEENELKLD